MERANFVEEIKERVEEITQSPKLGEDSLYRNYEYALYCKKCNEKHTIKLSTLKDPEDMKFDY